MKVWTSPTLEPPLQYKDGVVFPAYLPELQASMSYCMEIDGRYAVGSWHSHLSASSAFLSIFYPLLFLDSCPGCL